MLVLLLIQGAGGAEMVDAAEEAIGLALSLALGLAVVVVVARDVGDEIHWPSSELLGQEVESSGNGSLLHQLRKLMRKFADPASIDLASLRHEDHVTLHVASGLVVLAVGDFPREIRDQESRVADPSNRVVDDLGRRESLVATLVSEHPQSRSEKTLHESIQGPKTRADRSRGDILGSYELVEDEKGRGEGDDVTSDVVEARSSGTLETVLRDRIVDLLDGVVRNLEFVAVRVEQHAAAVLDRLCLGGQRRQRRRGSRCVGRIQRSGRSRGVGGVASRLGGDGPTQGAILRASGSRHGVELTREDGGQFVGSRQMAIGQGVKEELRGRSEDFIGVLGLWVGFRWDEAPSGGK